MVKKKTAERYAAIWFLWCLALMCGCAGGQTLQQTVTTEYLLTSSGFKPWDVNMETAKLQALMNSIPPGKIVTFIRNGQVYHVYSDEKSHTLYIGNEAAYQSYLAKARGQRMCQRITGPNQVQFWSCMDDYQSGQRLK